MRLIDAEELLEKIVNVPSEVTEKTFYDKQTDLLIGSAFRQNEIIDIVEAMQTVELKHGHWIVREKFEGGVVECECSQCHAYTEISHGIDEERYCYRCGARMDEKGMR